LHSWEVVLSGPDKDKWFAKYIAGRRRFAGGGKGVTVADAADAAADEPLVEKPIVLEP
jgi:hypothetical protein